MNEITWSNEKRHLSDLIPWKRNPRQIQATEEKLLQESLEEFGQVEPICIGPGNELYNGHQRLKAWAEQFGDIEIDVRVSSRLLTEKEREKLTVLLHRGAVGDWDFETLAKEFNLDELLDWGFTEKELKAITPQEKEKPDVLLDQAIQLQPAKEYVLVMCDEEDEFLELRRLLGLGDVRRGGYREGSPFDAVGVQRVIHASQLIGLLHDHRDSQ
jgi:hypothetical protein